MLKINVRKALATALILLACYGSVWAGKHLLPKYLPSKMDSKYRARSEGSPNAPLRVIEYMDFQCAACRMAFGVLREAFKVEPEKIYIQIRYYPLIHGHLYALKSAIYADCAAKQGKFWEFSGNLFETQEEWAASKEPDAFFEGLAQKSGLRVDALKACVEDPAAKESVLAEREEARMLGLKMTPTFFMNEKKVEGFEAMVIEMENFLAGQKKQDKP